MPDFGGVDLTAFRAEVRVIGEELATAGAAREAFGKDEPGAVRAWLRGKSGAIAGGSWEVQLNIISKRFLGPPEVTQRG